MISAMVANNVATQSLEDQLPLEAVRAHMQDQADGNSFLKELLETLDDQSITSSNLKGLLKDLEDLADDSPTLMAMLDRVAITDVEFEAKMALM